MRHSAQRPRSASLLVCEGRLLLRYPAERANENTLGHSISRFEDDCRSTTLQLNSDSLVEAELANILGLDLHRYPNPSHPKIMSRIAESRGLLSIDHVFLGVGSDEVIDLLIHVCVAPGREEILVTPPTYAMYSVCAQINDLSIVNVNLCGMWRGRRKG